MTEQEGDWIYAVGGKRIGPTSARKIAMLISADGLPAGTLVWKAGMTAWLPASDVPEIATHCAPPLPDLSVRVQGADEGTAPEAPPAQLPTLANQPPPPPSRTTGRWAERQNETLSASRTNPATRPSRAPTHLRNPEERVGSLDQRVLDGWTYVALPLLSIAILGVAIEDRSFTLGQGLFLGACLSAIYGLRERLLWAWYLSWLPLLLLAGLSSVLWKEVLIPSLGRVTGGIFLGALFGGLLGLLAFWIFTAWMRLKVLFRRATTTVAMASRPAPVAATARPRKPVDPQVLGLFLVVAAVVLLVVRTNTPAARTTPASPTVGVQVPAPADPPRQSVSAALTPTPEDHDPLASAIQKAEGGDVDAQRALGRFYYFGSPALGSEPAIAPDYPNALRWFGMASVKGDPTANYYLGLMYQLGNGVERNYGIALRHFREAAENGVATAQASLGHMYRTGEGASQDYAQALYWFRKGAAQEDSNAEYGLGEMYLKGQGVPQDYAEAASWHLKAAEHGSPWSQNQIGIMYHLAWGVPKDDVEAYKWASISAAKMSSRDERASKLRNALTPMLTSAELAEGQRRAREWMEMHDKSKR